MNEFVEANLPNLAQLHRLPDEDLDTLADCASDRLVGTAPDWECRRSGCFPWGDDVVDKRGYSWPSAATWWRCNHDGAPERGPVDIHGRSGTYAPKYDGDVLVDCHL